MPQIKIICLAHPGIWLNVADNLKQHMERAITMANGHKKSSSWLDISKPAGSRQGIFYIEALDDSKIFAKVAYEREVKEDYQSLEEILKEEGYLPKDARIPSPIPTASKAQLLFDLKEGICYVYTDTTPMPVETTTELLSCFGNDCSLPCQGLEIFEWEDQLVTTITNVAYDEGFQPYKSGQIWQPFKLRPKVTLKITVNGKG
jgi:hypothetical protein